MRSPQAAIWGSASRLGGEDLNSALQDGSGLSPRAAAVDRARVPQLDRLRVLFLNCQDGVDLLAPGGDVEAQDARDGPAVLLVGETGGERDDASERHREPEREPNVSSTSHRPAEPAHDRAAVGGFVETAVVAVDLNRRRIDRVSEVGELEEHAEARAVPSGLEVPDDVGR